MTLVEEVSGWLDRFWPSSYNPDFHQTHMLWIMRESNVFGRWCWLQEAMLMLQKLSRHYQHITKSSGKLTADAKELQTSKMAASWFDYNTWKAMQYLNSTLSTGGSLQCQAHLLSCSECFVRIRCPDCGIQGSSVWMRAINLSDSLIPSCRLTPSASDTLKWKKM